jgi:hypothetical protein
MAASDKPVVVIPLRYRVVQLAQDLARLRALHLVGYTTPDRAGKVSYYSWDAAKESWTEIALDDYRLGSVFGDAPRRLVLVGSDADLPAGLAQAAPWAQDVKRVTSLNIGDMVNGFNASLDFAAREWRWLAERYGLTLEDKNAERRRYGKYGPPGQKPTPPPKRDAGAGVMPAAVQPAASAPLNEPLVDEVAKPVFDRKPEPQAHPAAKPAEPEKSAPAVRSQSKRPEDK